MTKDEEVLQKKLLKYKLLSEKDLEEGLKAQRIMAELGIQKELRDVLIEKGFISQGQLKEAGLQKSIKYIIEGYTLVKILGKGSMGAVYKARRTEDQKIFAIKLLSSQLGRDMNFIRRFIREAKHCIDIEHDNIVKAYEVGLSNDRYYFTMEYIEGQDLRKKLNQQGPFPENELLTILTQILRALDYADSIGLIHRDIKPDNIIIDSSGVAKLCDLGLAKVGISDNHSLTQAGMVVGTPFYISPEQCRGRELNIRSDIYSLGATLYHMATGKVPFNAPDGIAILAKHVSEAPVPPKELRGELSKECNDILLKMLAKKPEDRYSPKSLLAEVGRLREQQYFASSLDIRFEMPNLPREQTHSDEETTFDLYEESELEEVEEVEEIHPKEIHLDEKFERVSPSQQRSSVLLKRSKKTDFFQVPSSAERSTVQKRRWSRKHLLLLVLSLLGLAFVLSLFLLQLFFDYQKLAKNSSSAQQVLPEEIVVQNYFPYETRYQGDYLWIESVFEDPSKSKFLWYTGKYQILPGKLVISENGEASCQIKFEANFFRLKTQVEMIPLNSVEELDSKNYCRIRFIGYQLILPLDGTPVYLCAQEIKQPLKISSFSLEPRKNYQFLIEKMEKNLRISILQNNQTLSLLEYEETAPLQGDEHNITNLKFRAANACSFVISQMEIKGKFYPEYLSKKYQQFLENSLGPK